MRDIDSYTVHLIPGFPSCSLTPNHQLDHPHSYTTISITMSLNSTTPLATGQSTFLATQSESESRPIRESVSGDPNKSGTQAVGERKEVSEPGTPSDVAARASRKPRQRIMQFREALQK